MRIRAAIVFVLLLTGPAALAAARAENTSAAYWSALVDASAECRQALSLYPREDAKTDELLDRVVAQNERLRAASKMIEPFAADESASEAVRSAARAFTRGVEILLDSNQLVFAAYETGVIEETDTLLQKAVALRSQGWRQVESAADASVRALDGLEPPLAARDASKLAAGIRQRFGREIQRESPPPLYRSLQELHDRLESVSEAPAAS